MMMSIALAVSLVLPAGSGGTVMYSDSANAFTVQVPAGWHAERASYSVTHYRGVFFCANNRQQGIRIHELEHGGRSTHFGKQIPRGTVYVDFAHFEGPGRSAMFGPGREDSFDSEIDTFLAKPKPREGRWDVDWYELEFMKWGSSWNVWILCRQPYTRGDLREALQLIESLAFPDLPIASEPQAVKAALHKLPAEARVYSPNAGEPCGPEDGWLAHSGRNGRYETRIHRSPQGFVVSFKLYTTGNSKEVSGMWDYAVHRDGSVVER